MATTLDGVTLPDPAAAEDGHLISFIDVGEEMVMADGSLRVHYIGSRRRFDLRWVGLTEAERNTTWYGYWTALLNSKAYSPPEAADTYTVLAVRDTWTEASFEEAGTTTYYNASFSLYEETPSSPELGMIKSESVSVAELVTVFTDMLYGSASDAIVVTESVSAAVV